MKLLRHWKLILGMTAIFGAGALTGTVVTLQGVKRALTERSALKRWGDARMAEFQRRLKLTPEQRKEIRPILDRTGDRFHGIVADAVESIRTLPSTSPRSRTRSSTRSSKTPIAGGRSFQDGRKSSGRPRYLEGRVKG